jgi:cyclopropane-fatty-acyl-phospholipid synthase
MLLARVLARVVEEGQLTIIDEVGRSHRIVGARAGPSLTLKIHDRWTGMRLALRPRLALGEAYMDGKLTVEDGDIYDLLDLVGRNMTALEATPTVKLVVCPAALAARRGAVQSDRRAERNVAHHYDLKDQLYDFFLDRDRQYSCAYFKTGDEPLEQAQLDKKQHIAAKMLLQPGQKVLDIGSGWGGMGLFLSQQFGVDVTGVTLSKEQHTVSTGARSRAASPIACASSCSTTATCPAASTASSRSACSSMSGVHHYVEFFDKVKRAAEADDGVMLLHSIGRMEAPGGTNTWLRKYIFPGGYSPALSEVLPAVERVGLWVTDIEILRLHYAETLRHGASASSPTASASSSAGYDERFCRMWEFYLAPARSASGT